MLPCARLRLYNAAKYSSGFSSVNAVCPVTSYAQFTTSCVVRTIRAAQIARTQSLCMIMCRWKYKSLEYRLRTRHTFCFEEFLRV